MKNLFILNESSFEIYEIEEMLKNHNLPYAYACFAKEGENPKRTDCFNCITSPEVKILQIKHNIEYILIGCKKCEGFMLPYSYPVKYRDIKFESKEFLQFSLIGQLAEIIGIENLTTKQLAVAAIAYNLSDAYNGKCPGVKKEDVLAVRIPFLTKKLGFYSETQLKDLLNGMVLYFELLKTNPEKIEKDFEISGVTILVEAKAISGIE